MKLPILALALASLSLATHCSAVFSFATAQDSAHNLQMAVDKANEAFPRVWGQLVNPTPLQNVDEVAHNNAVLLLRKPDSSFAKLGTLGTAGTTDLYDIFATDWRLDEPGDRLFVFSMHDNNQHYVPLGFVSYETRGGSRSNAVFWDHSGRLNRLRSPWHMGLIRGFPPQLAAPTRGM